MFNNQLLITNNHLPIISIENLTLAHFRHFRHFRSLLTNEVRKITYEKIKLFMQNEPNFRKSQMSVSDLLIRDYGQMDTWSIRKKQSQTNPNKANTNPIQTQYEPNSNPIYPVVASGEAGTNPIYADFNGWRSQENG